MIYDLIFSPMADKEIEELKKAGDKASLKKLNKLLVELMEHPYLGSGNPEPLKYDLSGYYSRRIDKKNRIIYRIDDEQVIVYVLSAKGHYDDK